MNKLLQVGKSLFALGKSKVPSAIIDKSKEHITEVVGTVSTGILIKIGIIVGVSTILFGITVGVVVNLF